MGAVLLSIPSLQGRFGGSQRVTARQGHNQKQNGHTKAKKRPAGQMTAPGLHYLQFAIIVKRFDRI